MSWQQQYMQRFYRRLPNWRSGTEEFYTLLRRHIPGHAEVLELGCGPENPVTRFLRENFAAVDGLDIDPEAGTNPDLRSARVYDGGEWPLDEASYDTIVCNYVLEHVEHPRLLADEIRRVLRPGGSFVFRTPSRWHYVSLASRLTPHWVHERIANRLRNLPDEAAEPYPTFYRMNSLHVLRRLLRRAGLEPLELRSIEKEPSYGMSHKGLFLAFMLYERIVNSDPIFAPLRVNILGAFRKTGGKGSSDD